MYLILLKSPISYAILCDCVQVSGEGLMAQRVKTKGNLINMSISFH